MNHSHRILRAKVLLLSLLLVFIVSGVAALCWAHVDDDDEDSESDQSSFASLSLTFDKRGGVDAQLWLDSSPHDWQPIQTALGRVLHCSPATFSNPAPSQYETKLLQRAQSSRRDESLKQLASYRQRQLQGKCESALAASGLTVSGDLPLEPLKNALAQEGKQFLMLSINRPATIFEEHSFEGLQPFGRQTRFLSYKYPLASASPIPPLHLAYGFRKTDVIRQVAIALGFLAVPVFIVLWMRRAALRDSAEDATAAWFSYFKTLQWCVNGTMLFWMVARTSFRQGLQDLITFRLGNEGWQGALASTLIIIVPPWTVYLLCLLMSYRVFVQLRGNRWKRHEFFLNQFFAVGAQFFPLMFIFAAIGFWSVNPRILVLLLLAAYFSRVLCLRGVMKMSRSIPEALTTGELRDRIFALAAKAGVAIKQVFVLSAGKAQIANAYAAKTNIVMFTDYLLERLSKREVDAIAGHELTHLRHKHPSKLGMTLIGAILFPTIFRGVWGMFSGLVMSLLQAAGDSRTFWTAHWLRFDVWFSQWAQLDLVLLTLGFGVFYLRARQFERMADEGSLQLVGDPEAMITGLLKISRLNLMPIQWGKVTGSILTHPSTLKRIEHIAKIGNLPQEKLQQILESYQQQRMVEAGDARGAVRPTSSEDHYTVAQAEKRVLTTVAAMRRATSNLWLLITAHVLPPALVAWSVHRFNVHGWNAFVAYVAGAVLTLAAYSLLTVALSLHGRKKMRDAFTRKFSSEGMRLDGTNVQLVGFSPGPAPRFYVSSYNWDTGFLVLYHDRLVFLGDKTRFALKPEHIVRVRMGPAPPGWWNGGRVYVDWRDSERGREGVFNLCPQEPISIAGFKGHPRALCAAVEHWRQSPASYPAAQPTLQSLDSPSLGEVTSQSPKALLPARKSFTIGTLIALVGYGITMLLSVPFGYVFAVILLLRVYEGIPHWRYREPIALATPAAPAARAQASGAR